MAVFDQGSFVQAYMPLALASGSLRFRNVKETAAILGIDHNLSNVFHMTLLHGSFPTKFQVENREAVALIDAELAKSAYHRTNVVGKTLVLSAGGTVQKLTVCGVVESQATGLSALFGGKIPCLIYVPYTNLIGSSSTISLDKVMILPKSQQQNIRLLEQLSRTTGLEYRLEDLDQYLDSLTSISKIVTLMIGGVAGISIIVGGIGVMNAMFSSIETRTKEIGIYRALGAKRRDIIRIFLFEAIILCLIGGSVGVASHWMIVAVLRQWMSVELTMSISGIGLSVLTAIICGVFAGWIPAIRAANLDPIIAIRED